jgi:hypothetical protein
LGVGVAGDCRHLCKGGFYMRVLQMETIVGVFVAVVQGVVFIRRQVAFVEAHQPNLRQKHYFDYWQIFLARGFGFLQQKHKPGTVSVHYNQRCSQKRYVSCLGETPK